MKYIYSKAASTTAKTGCEVCDRDEKPRQIFRIKRSDYIKLPPIGRKEGDPTPGAPCPRVPYRIPKIREGSKTGETLVRNRTETSQATAVSNKVRVASVTVPEVEISYWDLVEEDISVSKSFPRRSTGTFARLTKGRFMSLQPRLKSNLDINYDLLLKEVEIKKLIDENKTTLKQSLWDLGTRKLGAFKSNQIEHNPGLVEKSDSELLKSYLESRRTTLTLPDSAFGEWEYHTDPRDEYIPSQRTLMTDQEKSVTLHSNTVTPHPPCSALTDEEIVLEMEVTPSPDILQLSEGNDTRASYPVVEPGAGVVSEQHDSQSPGNLSGWKSSSLDVIPEERYYEKRSDARERITADGKHSRNRKHGPDGKTKDFQLNRSADTKAGQGRNYRKDKPVDGKTVETTNKTRSKKETREDEEEDDDLEDLQVQPPVVVSPHPMDSAANLSFSRQTGSRLVAAHVNTNAGLLSTADKNAANKQITDSSMSDLAADKSVKTRIVAYTHSRSTPTPEYQLSNNSTSNSNNLADIHSYNSNKVDRNIRNSKTDRIVHSIEASRSELVTVVPTVDAKLCDSEAVISGPITSFTTSETKISRLNPNVDNTTSNPAMKTAKNGVVNTPTAVPIANAAAKISAEPIIADNKKPSASYTDINKAKHADKNIAECADNIMVKRRADFNADKIDHDNAMIERLYTGSNTNIKDSGNLEKTVVNKPDKIELSNDTMAGIAPANKNSADPREGVPATAVQQGTGQTGTSRPSSVAVKVKPTDPTKAVTILTVSSSAGSNKTPVHDISEGASFAEKSDSNVNHAASQSADKTYADIVATSHESGAKHIEAGARYGQEVCLPDEVSTILTPILDEAGPVDCEVEYSSEDEDKMEVASLYREHLSPAGELTRPHSLYFTPSPPLSAISERDIVPPPTTLTGTPIPPLEDTQTPTHPSITPTLLSRTPTLTSTPQLPSSSAKKLPPPPPQVGLSFLEKEAIQRRTEERMLQRARKRSREEKAKQRRAMEAEAERKLIESIEISGDEDVHEILGKFTIIERNKMRYYLKIFTDYLPDERDYLNHTEMKKALSQLRTCRTITRNQLKFIEIILELDKDHVSFHTFAVMATLIEHMTHKDPGTQAMFDSIDLTRLEHDLPRLKRLFHCVSEIDDFGWPRLTTVAIDIELRAASVPEETRVELMKELDPGSKGEISIFDFILYTPLWMYLHDGIVENPFNETERVISSPLHRQWGVSVLWLPSNPKLAREGHTSAASGCGSERSTPELYTEPPEMKRIRGYDEDEEDIAFPTIRNSG